MQWYSCGLILHLLAAACIPKKKHLWAEARLHLCRWAGAERRRGQRGAQYH